MSNVQMFGSANVRRITTLFYDFSVFNDLIFAIFSIRRCSNVKYIYIYIFLLNITFING